MLEQAWPWGIAHKLYAWQLCHLLFGRTRPTLDCYGCAHHIYVPCSPTICWDWGSHPHASAVDIIEPMTWRPCLMQLQENAWYVQHHSDSKKIVGYNSIFMRHSRELCWDEGLSMRTRVSTWRSNPISRVPSQDPPCRRFRDPMTPNQ